MTEQREKLLEIHNLKQYFNKGTASEVRAVDDISLIFIKVKHLV